MRAWHTYAASRAENRREVVLTETHPQRKPGRLGAAEARLEAALGRIEAALDGIGREMAARADRAVAEARARVEADEARAGDQAAFAQLREENAALRHVQGEVSGRLDAAVERLRRALAH
jgi:hypothetical protein